jgi:hypothetical protein
MGRYKSKVILKYVPEPAELSIELRKLGFADAVLRKTNPIVTELIEKSVLQPKQLSANFCL